jgi:tetratricopeptide (TPR) repeat protein
VDGKAKQMQYNYYDAATEFEFALAHDSSAVIITNLGECYMAMNNLPKAETLFAEAIKRDSSYLDAYFPLAELRTNAKDFLSAEKLLKKVVAVDSSEENLLKLAGVYHNIDLSKTLDILRFCVKKFNNYELYLYMSDIYRYMQVSDSSMIMEESYYQSPDKHTQTIDNLTLHNLNSQQLSLSLKYIDTLQTYCTDEVFNKFLYKLFEYSSYKSPFDMFTAERIKKSLGNSTLDKDVKNVFLGNLAMMYVDTLKSDEYYANADMKKSEILNSIIACNMNYGRVYKACQIAVSNLDSVRFNTPEQASMLSTALIYFKMTEQALILLKRDAAKNKQFSVLNSVLGDTYLSIEKPDSAVVYYDRYVNDYPDNAAVRNNYAYALTMINGDMKKALNLVEYSLSKDPGNANYLDTFAWVNFLLGNADKAIEYLNESLKSAPNSEEPYNHLAIIYYLKGDIEKAVFYRKKALDNRVKK